MKKCSKCEVNYVTNANDEICEICKNKGIKEKKQVDDNKASVEQILLPFLRSQPQQVIDKFTTKEVSFDLFGLHHPLLVTCLQLGKERCKKEVMVGNSSTYRYYIEPYEINGQMYHICSQWANCLGNNSKNAFELIKLISSKM